MRCRASIGISRHIIMYCYWTLQNSGLRRKGLTLPNLLIGERLLVECHIVGQDDGSGISIPELVTL